MIPSHLARAAADPKLSSAAVRVLVVLHLEIPFSLDGRDSGFGPIKVAALAWRAGVSRSTCARAIDQLVALHYIEEGPPDPPLRTYRLRPSGWMDRPDFEELVTRYPGPLPE